MTLILFLIITVADISILIYSVAELIRYINYKDKKDLSDFVWSFLTVVLFILCGLKIG